MKDLIRAVRTSGKIVVSYFVVSRVLFFVLLIGSSAVKIESVPSREGLNFHVSIQNDLPLIQKNFTKTLLSGDPSWYMEIARYGYPRGESDTLEPRHWVFFPAYPLMVRGLYWIVGSFLGAAVLLNAVLFFIGLCFLREYLKDTVSDSTRNFVIAALAFHPMSYFFSLPQTEALFFCSLMGVLLLLKNSRFGMALVIVTALLVCSRPTGILMMPCILYLIPWKGKGRYRALSAISLGFSSVILFFLYLYQLTGSAFTWMTHQKTWGRTGIGENYSLININLITAWNFNALHFYFLILSVFSVIYFFRLRRFDYSWILVVPVIVLLKSGGLMSASRILMPLFPNQIFLGEILGSEKARQLYLSISCFLYGILALLFSLHVTLAMT